METSMAKADGGSPSSREFTATVSRESGPIPGSDGCPSSFGADAVAAHVEAGPGALSAFDHGEGGQARPGQRVDMGAHMVDAMARDYVSRLIQDEAGGKCSSCASWAAVGRQLLGNIIIDLRGMRVPTNDR